MRFDDTKEEDHMHQTDTACSWLVRHSATVGGTVRWNTVQIVSTYPASPASQFFGEASRAFPQHGWRSAYSLRETLSPTQDQGQHSRLLHTHTHTQPPTLIKFTDSLIQPPRPCPPPTLHSPPTTQNTHSHLLSTSPHTHSLHPRPNTTCPSLLSPHFPTTQTSTRPHACTLPHTQQTKIPQN